MNPAAPQITPREVRSPAPSDPRKIESQLADVRRIALAMARPASERLSLDLVRELSDILGARMVMVATFSDDSRQLLRARAGYLDGAPLQGLEYPIAGTPCELVLRHGFHYISDGVLRGIDPESAFAQAGLDAYAAFPLIDSRGTTMGVLAALDPLPIAGGDAEHAQALLRVVAGRLAAELERHDSDTALRTAAMAVSSARGEAVFDQLSTALALLLQVDYAMIARWSALDPEHLSALALCKDGTLHRDVSYAIAGTPCRNVLGQQFCIYPEGLRTLFPDNPCAHALEADSYAGHPLLGPAGEALGVIAVGSRHPLRNAGLVESMLKIFAARAAAEVERLSTLEALRRSEASYRTIFDNAEVAIFIHDWEDFTLVDVNQQACVLHQRTREELLKADPTELMPGEPPFDLPHALEHLMRAREGRCPPFEWRLRVKDGSLRCCDVFLMPVVLDGRRCILASVRDITARKQAELLLRSSEEQYRAIFNASADALVLWDSQFRRVDVNPAYERIFGWSRDEVVGRGYEPHTTDAYSEARHELIVRALAGETCRAELETRCKDGRVIFVEVHITPFRHRDEPHVLAILRDITERLERERELKRGAARLRATVEAAFDSVIGMDGMGRIVEFNSAAERMFGHRRDDVLGEELAEVILPERHRNAHRRALAQFQRGSQSQMLGRLLETTALSADGREIPIEMAISEASVPEGSIFVGYLRDISARRAAEFERQQLETQLRQAQKMEAVGQLTGGIAHDFNNLLTSVMGYTVLAQERAEDIDDGPIRRHLGQVQLAAERARDLVGKMLTFARRRGGPRERLSARKLVDETAELLRSTLPSSVVLEVDSPDEGDGSLQGDAVQLGQVLLNLCINARDAVRGVGLVRMQVGSNPGGWRCQGCGATGEQRHWIEISVSDNGCGIDGNTLLRIFEPFFTTKQSGQGSGMGLAMVHGIVHDHGGHVLVDTTLGKGTRFSVMLPMAQGSAAAMDADSSAPALPRAAVKVRMSGRVLVVEDDASVGGYLKAQLQAWGLDVVLQHDPREALDWLSDGANRADLMVTDLTMPHLSGLQLSLLARPLRPHLPVLLISADLASVDSTQIATAGVTAALPKPVDSVLLRATIREMLDLGAP